MAEGGIADVNFSTLANQARLLITGWPNFEYQLKQYCLSGRKHMTILLCGKTGVGKSHLTNALVGQALAKEGENLEPETDEVTPYRVSINNVEVTVFDTPGLADGTGNEKEYLRKIKERVTDLDVFIFCTEMNTHRFRNDDIDTVKKLTATFGSKLWQHAVVVLTFANEVRPPPSKKDVTMQEFFDQRRRIFKKKIKEVILEAGVAEEIVVNVPFVAAGDLSEPSLPGITNWMTAVWIATFKRLNRDAKYPFLLANIDRFNFSSSVQEVPRRNRPCRRSLPPRELGENHLRRQVQRRSFQGFELVDREHANSHNTDSENDAEHHRFKSRYCSVTEPRIPLETKPKQKMTEKRQDAITLDMNESSTKEVIMEIISEVGKGGSRVLGEWIQPGTGHIFAAVFSYIMKLIKRFPWRDSFKENGSDVKEYHTVEQEDD